MNDGYKERSRGPASLLRFLRPYRLRVALSILVAVVSSMLWLSLGEGLRRLIDDGLLVQSAKALGAGVLVLLGLVLAYTVLSYLQYWLVSWIGHRVTADVRTAVFAHVVGLHSTFFETNSPGEIESRITYDAGMVQYALSERVSDGAIDLFLVLGAGVGLFLLNPKLALLTLIIIPCITWPAMIFGRKIKEASSATQDRIAVMNDYVGESLSNIDIVQSYNRKRWHKKVLAGYVEKVFGAELSFTRRYGAFYAVVFGAVSCVIALMLWIGGRGVLAGPLSGGMLAAFIFYAYVAASSINDLTYVYGDFQHAIGSTRRLMELLQTKNDVAEPRNPLPAAQPRRGGLVLEKVGFHYPSRPDYPALADINLAIEPGETVAFVGRSGAGKSTLFRLLLRFHDPSNGAVFLDGVNIRNMLLDEARSYYALVPQTLILFSGTVMENIRYGRLDASDEEIEAAARAAYIHQCVVNELPDGYHTDIGAAGVRLSGGQRQRIAIARAILKDPRILLFDEATNALDAESETMVKKALTSITRGRTTLIIAHRLNTVKSADRIVVMDEGRLAAQGKHEDLLNMSPLYRTLAQSHQHGEEL